MGESESTKMYSQEEVSQMIIATRNNQRRFDLFDQGARECLNHLKTLTTPTKEYPVPALDPQVYEIIDDHFYQIRNQYLGIVPQSEQPVQEEPNNEP